MLVKRYHAKDMQQAREQIIKELGIDAVVLSSRKVRERGLINLFKRRILEVTVAYDPNLIPGAKPPEPPSRLHPPCTEVVSNERLERLDRRIDALDDAISDFIKRFSFIRRDITLDFSKEVEPLYCSLIENQVREELAQAIARETESILKKQPDTSAYEVMEQVILEYLGTPVPLKSKKFKQKIVMLMGSTGVGKTTSIVKLAADFAINQQRKVGIINTDTYRVAAQEQLKTYADILNIPLSVVYQTGDIKGELEAMSDREVIFIDTAGKRPGDEQHEADIKGIISACAPEEILLCVPATVNFAALKEIVDSYSHVENYKLLVTKLDETRHRGMILNLCWYTRKALSYFTTGQNVPDDIETIDTDRLVSELLGRK